jgi:glycosyltransferase involved in cell wall biosynthesis
MNLRYKIAHITYDDYSGAGKAALRICQAQRNSGYDSVLFVINKKTNFFYVKKISTSRLKNFFYKVFDRAILKVILRKKTVQFSIGNLSVINSLSFLNKYKIVNLHWINSGLLSNNLINKLIKIKKYVFWTIHDMWPFTGGCHYSNFCSGFETNCKNCPLVLPSMRLIPEKIYNYKVDYFNKIITISPSNWMLNNVSHSKIFSKSSNILIHNPIDHNIFSTNSNKRDSIDNSFNILFGSYNYSTDLRKGFKYLLESIKIIKYSNPSLFHKLTLHIFGSADSIFELSELGVTLINHGRISNDHSLVEIYQKAHLFLAPSIEENLANTVNESLACGTPILAFNIGGMPDMIDHKTTGYLAVPYSSIDISNGIEWIHNNYKLIDFISNCENKSCKTFSQSQISKKYLDTYYQYIK